MNRALPAKRFLIVNPFGIGDVIFSMVLVEALRRLFPAAFIGFLCNERTADLVRMNASIDRTFVFNRDRFRKLWKKHPVLFFRKLRALVSAVREHRFDTLFDLSLARQYSFLAMAAGIRERIGLNYRNRGIFLTRRWCIEGYEGQAVADTQLKLLRFVEGVSGPVDAKINIPLSVSDASRNEADRRLRQDGIFPQHSLLAMAPGGGRSWGRNAIYKQWDAERFAQVSNDLAGRFPHRVVLLGDRTEQALLERTAAAIRTETFLACGEPLDRVCALLLRSRLLLCNDGGLLHLANALGVKTVSIFGPVDAAVYGPYFKRVSGEVVTVDVPCRPCYRRFHFPPCPYERRCLTGIATGEVVQAVQKIV